MEAGWLRARLFFAGRLSRLVHDLAPDAIHEATESRGSRSRQFSLGRAQTAPFRLVYVGGLVFVVVGVGDDRF